MAGKVIELNDADFDQMVHNNDVPVLVDFWAPWCGPCQVMGPIVEELATEMGDKVKIGKLDVDENGATAQKYGIMSIPSLKIFKGGIVVKEFTGVQNKETLREELDKL